MCGIYSLFSLNIFAEKLYLKLVEIQEYTDQYLEYGLNNTELNITM